MCTCKEHEITVKTINELIDTFRFFNYDHLIDLIDQRGGTYRTSVGVTIREYLEESVRGGIIFLYSQNR